MKVQWLRLCYFKCITLQVCLTPLSYVKLVCSPHGMSVLCSCHSGHFTTHFLLALASVLLQFLFPTFTLAFTLDWVNLSLFISGLWLLVRTHSSLIVSPHSWRGEAFYIMEGVAFQALWKYAFKKDSSQDIWLTRRLAAPHSDFICHLCLTFPFLLWWGLAPHLWRLKLKKFSCLQGLLGAYYFFFLNQEAK